MNQHINSILALVLVSVFCTGCFEFPNSYSSVAPGIWRGTLELVPNFITPNPKGKPLPEKLNLEFDEVTEGELPFNFEIVYDNDTTFHMIILNGEEKIKVTDIHIGKDIRTGSDTFLIQFPVYDTYLQGAFEEDVMQGNWVVNYREENGIPYEIPFIARFGQAHRFTTLKKEPLMDISGSWNVLFGVDRESPEPAIGEFKQEGNYVEGTFITESGDHRFLQGTIQENKVYLSAFDGGHAFLYEAKINPDQTMIGSYRSGRHYATLWEAQKSQEASFPSSFDLTPVNEAYPTWDFNFENTQGEEIRLDAPPYAGKGKVIQLFGTWCPNCHDQTQFLLDFLAQQKEDDIAVIGLAFERYQDKNKAFNSINRYKERLNIPYEVLYGGFANKDSIPNQVPVLEKFLGYPTLIFLDKDNTVQQVHTGFTGPATSKYEEFVTDFENSVKAIR